MLELPVALPHKQHEGTALSYASSNMGNKPDREMQWDMLVCQIPAFAVRCWSCRSYLWLTLLSVGAGR